MIVDGWVGSASGLGLARAGLRIAGTRFLLLLGGISRDQATVAAEQVRQSLEGVTLEWQGTMLQVAARIGITSVEPGDTLELLLARLERALERAERAGRNRCAIVEGKEAWVVAPHQVPVIARRVDVAEAGELVGQPL